MEVCNRIMALGAMLHFLVDGLCVCCLYMTASSLDAVTLASCILVYNVLAFTTQPLTGMLVDMAEKKNRVLWIAVVVLSLAVCLMPIISRPDNGYESMIGITIAVLLGVGNSFFHVWGGKQIVISAGNEIKRLGVYVSTGAFGLSIGFLFHSWTLLYLFWLAICILSVLVCYRSDSHISATPGAKSQAMEVSTVGSRALGLVLLIMVLVACRSYIGELFSSLVVEKDEAMILMIAIVSMSGKMAGGWIVSRFGFVNTVFSLLVIAAVCYSMNFALGGIFAINCTMPITLYWANHELKGREGLAFGLLAFALVPGYYLYALL